MPLTKNWLGTTGDLQLSTNWAKVSLRNSSWRWVPSGSGTNEYYLQTSGGANPGLGGTPALVYLNGTSVSSGTLGSLAASRWGYGDNDSLGYSTLYVRLSDGADPDSKAADWVQMTQIPLASQHVHFPISGGVTVSSNLDLSAITIGDFSTAADWRGEIGSETSWLRIDPTSFTWSGGKGYVDLGAANIPIRINNTEKPNAGYQALHLRGSAITTANILGGSIGLAAFPGDTATVTTLRVVGKASMLLGSGLTLATIDQRDGDIVCRCNPTTVNVFSGKLRLDASSAPTTVNIYGSAEVVYASSGNVTTINQYGGLLDLQASGASRTITAYNRYGGTVRYNPEAVTITTLNDKIG